MKNTFQNFFKAFAFSYIVIMLCACPGRKAGTGVDQKKADSLKKSVDTVIHDAVQKKDAYMKQLKGMSVPELAKQLSVESNRGLEPFNSLAYGEAVSRGREAASQLSNQITDPSRSSLLAVLAVRKMDSGTYQRIQPGLRSHVLLDALANASLYNEFGLPHVKWEEAALAIIGEGKNVVDSLERLLQDTKPAPVWGSEDFAEYQRYQYRVCDYSWALLMAIRGESITIPQEQKERDRLIAEYIRKKNG